MAMGPNVGANLEKQNIVYLHGSNVYSQDKRFELHGLLNNKTVEPKSQSLKATTLRTPFFRNSTRLLQTIQGPAVGQQIRQPLVAEYKHGIDLNALSVSQKAEQESFSSPRRP